VLADASWNGGRGYRHVETAEGFRFQFHGMCDVFVTHDRRSVAVQLAQDADPEMIPVLLQGNVLAALLLLAGKCVLHASGVDVGGKALAFVGGSGTGKSTLAALCCAAGAAFLTDDLLRVESHGGALRCFYGGHEVRLRSQAASLAALFPDAPSHHTVDGRLAIRFPGCLRPTSHLVAVVIPTPTRSGCVRIERLAPLDAWTALMQAPRVLGVRDHALLRTQFETCSLLAQTVPVYCAEGSTGPPYEASAGADLLSEVGLA
jgi:hypothetical protein